MSSNISIDLSVGSIIQYDQFAVDEILSLNFEDILLSECEDFWLDQPDSGILPSNDVLFEFLEEESAATSAVTSHEEKLSSAVEENSLNQTSDVVMEELCSGDVPVEFLLETEEDESITHQSADYEMTSEETQEPITEADNEKKSFAPNNGLSSLENVDSKVSKCSCTETSINIHAITKGSCDNTNMFVKPAATKGAKKLCCPFCDKLFSKLARHLATMHKNEPDVKKFVALPKGAKERRLLQDSLRKLGTYKWNSNADLNKNELIPSRRPSGHMM
ncbi:hypothetical protein Bhyg_12194, partial [Pseudolycoriella hygida]